jgi:Bacterial toxin 44
VLSCIYQYDKLGRLFWGKLFKWVGKTLKWIGIAAAIAVAVISIAFPGAWIANLALWASKHSILSAVLGINTPKFAIINLASLGAKSGAIALGAGAYVASTVGAVTSLLAQKFGKDTERTHHNPCSMRGITIPPGVSVGQNIKIAQEKVHKIYVLAGMTGDLGGTAGLINAALWFRNQVRNAKGRVNDVSSGKSWDYKQLGRQFESFGNFNYGATAAATGLFDDKTIFEQAGKAQTQAGTSNSQSKGPPFYGDDPRDHDMIRRGIEYFRADCHNKNK